MRATVWAFCVCVLTVAAMSPVAACDLGEPHGALAPTLASYASPADRFDVQIAVGRINDLRREAGLPALRLSRELSDAAQHHAVDLARRDDISHYGADGSTPVTRVARTGYDAVQTGENIATGQRSLDEVLVGWMNSETHRDTLLSRNAVDIGLALVYDPNTTYRTFWTMVVAEPF